MCEGCWVEDGQPAVWTADVAEAAQLVRDLLVLEPDGGPLRVGFEDLRDVDALDVEPRYGSPDRYSAEVHRVCDRLAQLLTPMTPGWRASVSAHAEGWAVEGVSVRRPTALSPLGSSAG